MLHPEHLPEDHAHSLLADIDTFLRHNPATAATVEELLTFTGAKREALLAFADRKRRELFGETVYLRGIVEISNTCSRNCLYCGIRHDNSGVNRYRMSREEILASARQVKASGCTTIVLQSGEPPPFSPEDMAEIIRAIKDESGLAITLSLGVASKEVYRLWQEAGMDRYLLRFESSDPEIYRQLHPDSALPDRIQALRDLRSLDVQTGSGFLIGPPGATLRSLAENIMLCRKLDLDMIGVGPFIAHPDTPLADSPNRWKDDPEILFAVIALLRIFCPQAHIPATTAFDAFFPGSGRERSLRCGANVFMPNATPPKFSRKYLLYPDKPGVDASWQESWQETVERLKKNGRKIGKGPGHALRMQKNSEEKF